MAVNLAAKYSKKVDERFKIKSITEASVHQDFDWEGVNAINVYSIATSAMNNYVRSGLSRYGVINELDDTVANYLLTRDRSFTFSIDRGNREDSMMVREAGKALARQNDEVVVPEIDTYRLGKYATAAAANGGRPTATNITASTAYTSFLTAQEYLDENKVPSEGRVVYATPKYINLIKIDPNFTKNSESGSKIVMKGQVGEIDGVPVIKAITTYMPTKTPFILTHKSVMCAPKKLQEYKIHENPVGINGHVVEGRIYYDAFVLDAKKKGVYAWLEV